MSFILEVDTTVGFLHIRVCDNGKMVIDHVDLDKSSLQFNEIMEIKDANKFVNDLAKLIKANDGN